jgi:hypothetical protein
MHRFGLITGTLIGICVFVVASLAAIVLIWKSALSLDQRLVAVGDTLAAGGLFLAIVASVVAVLAYRVSIQRPSLVATAEVDGAFVDIELGLDGPDSAGERRIARLPHPGPQSKSVPLVLRIENDSAWSARNVAVRIDVKGMRGIGAPMEWSRAGTDGTTGHTSALKWEGGADYAIHGNWTRELPPLELAGVIVDPPLEACELLVDVVAEGFRKTWTFPLKFVPQGEVFDRETGSIDGWAGYPSEGVPALRVYAIPLQAGLAPTKVTTPDGPTGKLRWFRISKLTPGQYHVMAYRHGSPSVSGGYTAASKKNDLTERADHTLAAVEVTAGGYATDVLITDWYSRDFPPEP